LKFVNKKIPSNMSQKQKQALHELKNNPAVDIYQFDKGSGFALLNKEDAISKIKDQLGEAKVISKDPTNSLTKKFQSTLSSLRKEDKLNNKTFYAMYPSDAIPPRMYGMLKAHKPQKDYPMRIVVSTIGSPMYGTSKHLVELIQPVLDKSETRLRNSSAFVEKAKTWKIEPNETQVSFDVVGLYPAIPIRKAIDVMLQLLQDDWDNVRLRTKLTIADIKNLLELCLNICYFMWDGDYYTIDDAGPIGLSLMVVMAEGYLQFTEGTAIANAIQNNFAPVTFYRYVDDSHSRFKEDGHVDKFLVELNSQDPKIQYTVEKEDNNELAFLDVSVINNKKGSYDFKVFRKDAITNVQIKPNSSINPSITRSVFKGFLVRANRICSEKYLQEEIEFLVKVFAENGHDRDVLKRMVDNYLNTNDPGEEVSTERRKSVKIPWIPKIGPKLRKVYKNNGVDVIFTSTPNLGKILCNHKYPLPPNSRPGVYKVSCGCGSATYVGETKKKVSTRIREHERDVFHGRWDKSGLSEHARSCSSDFKFDQSETIALESNYKRRKIREALEIRRQETAPRLANATNRDRGNIMRSESWNALLNKIPKNH